MSHVYYILPVILIIVFFQIRFFLRGRLRIIIFKNAFPSLDYFSTVKLYVSEYELKKILAKELLASKGHYSSKRSVDEYFIEVTLIDCEQSMNTLSAEMLEAINTYLLKNKGAVSDFNMIKDIVNRYCDSVEDEINAVLPIPLYLGLIGTMFGIIVGLIALDVSQLGTDNNLMDSLMKGVGIAMFSSCLGLLLTTINSGWLFKDAKNNTEQAKNRFFTFIQTQLLPILTQDATTSIFSLQKNLVMFNEKFENNVSNFSGLLDKILISFDNQVNVIHELKELDIASIQQFNVRVLRELKNSVAQLEGFSKAAKEFERFGSYIASLNDLIDHSQLLNNSITAQLERTQTIEQVLDNLNNNVQDNRQLCKFIESHFSAIEQSGEVLRGAVIDVDRSIGNSMSMLGEHANQRLVAIQKMGISEDMVLRKYRDSSEVLVKTTMESIEAFLDQFQSSLKEKVKVISSIYIEEKEGVNELFKEEFAKLNKLDGIKEGIDEMNVNLLEVSEIHSSSTEELRKISQEQLYTLKSYLNAVTELVSKKEYTVAEILDDDSKSRHSQRAVPTSIAHESRFSKVIRNTFYVLGILAFFTFLAFVAVGLLHEILK